MNYAKMSVLLLLFIALPTVKIKVEGGFALSLAQPSAEAASRRIVTVPATAPASALSALSSLSNIGAAAGVSSQAKSILLGSVGSQADAGTPTIGGLATSSVGGGSSAGQTASCTTATPGTPPVVTTTSLASLDLMAAFTAKLSSLSSGAQRSLSCVYTAATDSVSGGPASRAQTDTATTRMAGIGAGAQTQLGAAIIQGISSVLTTGSAANKISAASSSISAVISILQTASDAVATAVSNLINLTTQVAVDNALEQYVLNFPSGSLSFVANPAVVARNCYAQHNGDHLYTQQAQINMESGQTCSDYGLGNFSTPVVSNVVVTNGALQGQIGDTVTCSADASNADGRLTQLKYSWATSASGNAPWTTLSSQHTSTLTLLPAASFAGKYVRCSVAAQPMVNGVAVNGLDSSSVPSSACVVNSFCIF